MSYVDNLFASFTFVTSNSVKSKKTLDDLIKFFKARVEIEELHMRGLEKLANFAVQIREGTILSAVNAMKNDYYSRAFQTKTLIDFINSDIINSLQTLNTTQAEIMKPVNIEASKVIKTKEAFLSNVQKTKKLYWRSCEECEKLTESLENTVSQGSREKILAKLVQEKQALDLALEQYQYSLAAYSKFREGYKDLLTPALNYHELQEKERLESMKDCLRKLVVYDTSFIRNVEYDLNSLAKFVEAISTGSDFKMIVDECDESDLPVMEFEQFLATVPLSTLTSPLKHSRSFNNEMEPGSILEIYVTEFEAVFQKLHIDLDSEDFQIFNSLVKDSIGRQAWISVLKGKPAKLRTKAYDQLAELMISVLNECERNNDSTILMDSLLYINYFRNKKGEFLTKLLSFHSIWGQLHLWEEVIEKMIQKEIQVREVDKIFEEESGKKGIIKNIAFCQLGTIAEYMKNFKVDVIYASEILAKNACRYELNSEDIDTLVATVDTSFKKNRVEVPAVQKGIPDWLKDITLPPKRAGVKTLESVFQLHNNPIN